MLQLALQICSASVAGLTWCSISLRSQCWAATTLSYRSNERCGLKSLSCLGRSRCSGLVSLLGIQAKNESLLILSIPHPREDEPHARFGLMRQMLFAPLTDGPSHNDQRDDRTKKRGLSG